MPSLHGRTLSLARASLWCWVQTVNPQPYIAVGQAISLVLGQDISLVVGQDISLVAGQDISLVVGQDISMVVGQDISLVVGQDISLVVGQDISLVVGQDISLVLGADCSSTARYYDGSGHYGGTGRRSLAGHCHGPGHVSGVGCRLWLYSRTLWWARTSLLCWMQAVAPQQDIVVGQDISLVLDAGCGSTAGHCGGPEHLSCVGCRLWLHSRTLWWARTSLLCWMQAVAPQQDIVVGQDISLVLDAGCGSTAGHCGGPGHLSCVGCRLWLHSRTLWWARTSLLCWMQAVAPKQDIVMGQDISLVLDAGCGSTAGHCGGPGQTLLLCAR